MKPVMFLIILLCMSLPVAFTACDDQTDEPTPAPTPIPTSITTSITTSIPTSMPTSFPTSIPTSSPSPAPTEVEILDGVFVRLTWDGFQHITVKTLDSEREYDFWILQDTGISMEDLIEGDRIKVTWRVTTANIPQAGGRIQINEAVKIEYAMPPASLNYLNCTFVRYLPGDFQIAVQELNSTATRDFFVLRDTGVHPEELKPGERIRVTWRNVDLRIPETIEKLNVNEAVRIERLD